MLGRRSIHFILVVVLLNGFSASVLLHGPNNLYTDGIWIGSTWIANPHCGIASLPMTYSRQEAAQCLHGKTVVFGGNSVTRHLYRLLKFFLEGNHIDETQEGRMQEKNEQKLEEEIATLLKRNETMHTNSSMMSSTRNLMLSREQQCESKRKDYGELLPFCMLYNSNAEVFNIQTWSTTKYFDSHVNQNKGNARRRFGDNLQTSFNHPQNSANHPVAYNGTIKFQWVYDWYTPLLLSELKNPNTIVTTNAGLGLNYLWAHTSLWEKDDPQEIIKTQFPILWKAPIHPSSMLIYRHSTASCMYTKGTIDIQKTIDFYVRNHHPFQKKRIQAKADINRHSRSSKKSIFQDSATTESKCCDDGQRQILPLLPLTEDLLHYIDCNHHPGVVSRQTIQFLLNMICRKDPFRHLGTLVSPISLLRQFENSIIQIAFEHVQYWFVSQQKVKLNPKSKLMHTLNNTLQLPIYVASSSFKKLIPDMKPFDLSKKLDELGFNSTSILVSPFI